MTDSEWLEIEAAYIAGEGTYKALSDRFDVSFATLQRRARKYHWYENREKTNREATAKLVERIAEDKAEELFDSLKEVSELIKLCDSKLAVAEAKSWEAVASLKLKAIAMVVELQSKATQSTDDGWD